MPYWVYILRCSNNALYTGYTHDLQKRYQEHLEGKGAKYTRSFKPILIEIAWQVSDKSGALRIEAHIKKLSKQEKSRLISAPQRINDTLKQLSCDRRQHGSNRTTPSLTTVIGSR